MSSSGEWEPSRQQGWFVRPEASAGEVLFSTAARKVWFVYNLAVNDFSLVTGRARCCQGTFGRLVGTEVL